MTRKGQMIAEYSSLIGLALIFAIIIIGFIVIQGSRNTEERHKIAVESQLARIQNEVLSAYSANDGYYSIIEFYPPYMGVRMNITIQDSIAIIRSSNTEGIIYLPPMEGNIVLEEGTIRIDRSEGKIVVNTI